MGEIDVVGEVPAIEPGVDNLKAVASDVAQLMNIGSKVLHGNYFALFGLGAILGNLQAIDFKLAGSELKNCDDANRLAIRQVFNSNLALVDAEVQAKIVAGEDFLDEAIVMVEEVVAEVKKGIDLVNRVKLFLGV